MPRTLTAAVSSALAGANVPALVFIQMEFGIGSPSDTLYVTNAAYDVTWSGRTWLGAGMVGAVGAVKESAELQAYGVELTLSGVPPDRISQALGTHYQGNPIVMWFAPLDASYNVLADPVEVFRGRMDNMDIELGETATIRLRAESHLADLKRPRVRRYNDADQQAEHSGDLGFQYVEQMVDAQIKWGVA